MLMKKRTELTPGDVTPRGVYLDRRKFLEGLGLAFEFGVRADT